MTGVTGGIIDAAYHPHRGLGPGLLESIHETVLANDPRGRGLYMTPSYAPTPKEGLRRIVNGLDSAASRRLRVTKMPFGDSYLRFNNQTKTIL